jgi:transcriptional regulator with XRE-family HTH domain
VVASELVTFAALLKRYRLAAGLTQEGLAERANLSVRGLSNLERGVRHLPQHATIGLLAEALRLTGPDRATFEAAARAHSALSPTRCQPPTGGTLPPLVGRARELAVLERHLAGEGAPVLVLAGELGIGKSRLLQEAGQRAPSQGWRVLQGGCQRRGGQEPYAPLLGALKRYIRDQAPVQLRADLQGCAWLVRLLPELTEGPIEPLPSWTLPPEQERRLMFEAVARFLANVAGPSGSAGLL